MALIILRGRYAVGGHAFATVDDEDFHRLSAWRWKAKPNGSGTNVYAVRNAMVGGKCVTIRMHREVLGLSRQDTRDVDHINHNPLDNRRVNLRAVTRSMNIKNARTVHWSGHCKHCGVAVQRSMKATSVGKVVCQTCAQERAKKPHSRSVHFVDCKHCAASFIGRSALATFCSDRCRCAEKRRRVAAAKAA